MNAREAILAKVRAGLGDADPVPRRAVVGEALATPARGPQPQLPDDLVACFAARASALANTVEEVAGIADAPAAVARYLAAQGLGTQLVATLAVAGLDWAAAGLAVDARPAVDADAVGVTGCFCAIAETGTLMLLSGPGAPASVSLLPETHVALVPRNRIVATMEDGFALLQAAGQGVPRAINFVSGPSRTGDIEQTIVLGAHGPRRVHLVIVGGDATMLSLSQETP